jgi:sec-independent protein translocase protein TatC
MCVLAGSLTLLFELAVQISRLNDRKKTAENEWANLSDDEASPLNYDPQPETATPESEVRATVYDDDAT